MSPVPIDERASNPTAQGVANPVGERPEEVFIPDGLVFKGTLARPVVEGDGTGPEAISPGVGDADGCPLGDVVVDDQVDGRPAHPRGDAGDGEVLDPDARVEEFGLVPRDDDRPRQVDRRGDVEPGPLMVSDRGGDGVGSDLPPERGIGPTLEVVPPGREPADVRPDQGGGRVQGRLGEDRPVGLGGAEAVGLHQQHPPATASPDRSIASRKTER